MTKEDELRIRREAFREAANYLLDSWHKPKYCKLGPNSAIFEIANDIRSLVDEKEVDLAEACPDAYDIVSHGSGGDSEP